MIAADQGRAQALKDLIKSKYGMKATYCGSRSQEQTIFDVFGHNPTNTVFIAIDQEEMIFWFIHNGTKVKLRKNAIPVKQMEGVEAFLNSLVETVYDELGLRAVVKCEDRSLTKLRNETWIIEKSRKLQSHSCHLHATALRKLYDVITGPILSLVHGDELLIIPEGPLCMAPFAAFMDSNSKFLCESFRI